VAEDNQVNQKVALRLLERLGYGADLAANGLEAVKAVRRRRYDVVLMDVHMPEMDGLEAARNICAEWPPERRPKIVAMTANAMQGDREKCLAAGMDDYISKPVQLSELEAALARIERRHAPTPRLAPSAETDAIDLGALEQLQGPEPGSDFVCALIGEYLEEAAENLRALREAVRSGDARRTRSEAHRLKGSSASVGAQRLAGLCAELEERGREGTLEGAEALADRIEVAFETARAKLSEYKAAS
jgi:CheY-like chemotaxis protein/HPt (histidine-containing phosphotransfer) domain-containing protein